MASGVGWRWGWRAVYMAMGGLLLHGRTIPMFLEEQLDALKKILYLEATDMLPAYGKLIANERLFEALMALPEEFRKPWLLTLD